MALDAHDELQVGNHCIGTKRVKGVRIDRRVVSHESVVYERCMGGRTRAQLRSSPLC